MASTSWRRRSGVWMIFCTAVSQKEGPPSSAEARGAAYGGNAYPFVVTQEGVSFRPITNVEMHYEMPAACESSGNEDLDAILGGGYHRGRCILIAGETGTGKTSMANTFVQAACGAGQRVLYVNYEESREGLLAGMRSLGIDLGPALEESLLEILPLMPESMGMEEHLFLLDKTIEGFRPDHVVVDAVSACRRIAGEEAAFDFLVRLVSACRERGITAMLINQVRRSFDDHELSGVGISSIIDTIVTIHYRNVRDEVQRFLLVMKSRGNCHSNKYHKFFLTDRGIEIER